MKQVKGDVIDVKLVKGDIIGVHKKPTKETFLYLGVKFTCM